MKEGKGQQQLPRASLPQPMTSSNHTCSRRAAALTSLSLTSYTKMEPSSDAVTSSCSSQVQRSREMGAACALISVNSPGDVI